MVVQGSNIPTAVREVVQGSNIPTAVRKPPGRWFRAQIYLLRSGNLEGGGLGPKYTYSGRVTSREVVQGPNIPTAVR